MKLLFCLLTFIVVEICLSFRFPVSPSRILRRNAEVPTDGELWFPDTVTSNFIELETLKYLMILFPLRKFCSFYMLFMFLRLAQFILKQHISPNQKL